MNTDKITCPKCKTEIPITEALQGQIEGRIRKEYDQKWEIRENAANERDDLASQREKDLVIERESFDALVSNQVKDDLKKERKKLVIKIRGEEQEKINLDLTELKTVNEAQEKQIGDYKTKIIKDKREQLKLKQEKGDLAIQYQERLFEESEKIEQKVTAKMDDKYRLRMAEKDKTISDTNIQLEEAKRKLNQGSQQL